MKTSFLAALLLFVAMSSAPVSGLIHTDASGYPAIRGACKDYVQKTYSITFTTRPGGCSNPANSSRINTYKKCVCKSFGMNTCGTKDLKRLC